MGDHAAFANNQARWPAIVSGLVMIVAAAATWLLPEWFVPLVGTVAIVEGVRLAWLGLFARRDDGLDGARIAIGLLAVLLGVALWLYPDKTAALLLYAASGWAIVFGLFIAILGIKDLRAVSGWWWEVRSAFSSPPSASPSGRSRNRERWLLYGSRASTSCLRG